MRQEEREMRRQIESRRTRGICRALAYAALTAAVTVALATAKWDGLVVILASFGIGFAISGEVL